MDGAVVEAAAYVIQSEASSIPSLCIRALGKKESELLIKSSIAKIQKGTLPTEVYAINPFSFSAVPGSPLAYWVAKRVLQLFSEFPLLENDSRTVKQGLATADDFRFLRLSQEISPEYLEGIWRPFAKGGEYAPFYSDIHLVVNWNSSGEEIRNFIDQRTGKIRSRPQNISYYFQSGFTYTSYTNLGFAPRVLPEGVIFSIAGMGIFGLSLAGLAILNSNLVQYITYLLADRRKWEAGVVQRIPLPYEYGSQESSSSRYPVTPCY